MLHVVHALEHKSHDHHAIADHLMFGHLAYIMMGGTVAILVLLTIFVNPAVVSRLGIEYDEPDIV